MEMKNKVLVIKVIIRRKMKIFWVIKKNNENINIILYMMVELKIKYICDFNNVNLF